MMPTSPSLPPDRVALAQQELSHSLAAAIVANAFNPQTFFAEWFRIRGKAYTFVFKKNLKVTNIQLAELFALLRTYTKYTDGSDASQHMQFIGSSDFTRYVTELVDAFPNLSDPDQRQLMSASRRYAAIFGPLIAVEPLFGTCTIFTPPTLRVDLRAICAHAGYIHSCGYSIFIRKVYKATPDELITNVAHHIDTHTQPGTKAFFAVYSHEDFTGDAADGEARSALDDLKISVDKFYIGSQRLVTVLRELQRRLGDHVAIPEPGDYRERHRAIRQQETVDKTRTLWLLIDHSLSAEPRHRGEVSYFICYDQLFHNENPFHVFDEDKPAWIDHTTIPHTLMGAMINLTRPWHQASVTVVDPFAGAGTTLLEATKFTGEGIITGRDINKLAAIGARDNLEFFSYPALALEELERGLDALVTGGISRLSGPQGYAGAASLTDVMASYRWALDLFDHLTEAERRGEARFSEGSIDELRGRSFRDRLMFYMFLRTARRNLAAFERGSTIWNQAFDREVKRLAGNIRRLQRIRRDEESGMEVDGYRVYQGSYSRSTTVSAESLARLFEGRYSDLVAIRDARTLEPESYDVIITDPPYGFNTGEAGDELADLYATVIDRMVGALKNSGQLVFAVPDWSHIGRQLPFYVLKEFVVLQVLIAASIHGREIIETGFSAPSPGRMFRPPYYWESDRALRRAILHFRIRRSGS